MTMSRALHPLFPHSDPRFLLSPSFLPLFWQTRNTVLSITMTATSTRLLALTVWLRPVLAAVPLTLAATRKSALSHRHQLEPLRLTTLLLLRNSPPCQT